MVTYIIDITISILFFLIGFLGILLARKIIFIKKVENQPIQESYQKYNYDEKNLEFEIIDALLSKYNEKIENLEQKIVEQKVKLDGLELFLTTHFPNQVKSITKDSSDKSQYTSTNITIDGDITDLKITNGDNEKRLQDIGSGTITNVLKILKDESKSSIEIKNEIGRTREHTARLMKKLTEMNLVERQSNFKPFKYKISNVGKEYLEKES
ncbi:MAG: hypothetical protein DA328_05685 [Nitrososphaeraceae archaeon]|nr:hypothetical protein [Nitrososphaeraceae archaeon]